MAENSNQHVVATVAVQAVAERGNIIAEFKKILAETEGALAKEGGVTLHSDTSAAMAEVKKFIDDTKALLEKGLGDVDLESLAKDFASQMSSVKGEIKGISDQLGNLNRLMDGFGAGASKNLGELEKRTEGTRVAVSKLQQQSQKATQSTEVQIKSEKELQATLAESQKRAQEYTKELKKLDDKKEQSKAAQNALLSVDEGKRLDVLKAKWAEMQKVQADIERGGVAKPDGSVGKYSAEGLERTKNKLNEIKKTIIDLQQSLTGVDFAKLGMQNITGEDEALREQFIAYRQSIEEKEQKYLNIVKEVNAELEKRKGITQETKPATSGQLTEEELKFVQETVAAKKAEATEQARITQEVNETVSAYEAEKANLQSLLDIQQTLNSVKDQYVEPNYTSQADAEKDLVVKAKEFYSIWSAAGEKTDEHKIKMSLLATEMKAIVDQYRSADLFSKVMSHKIGDNGYAFSGAYADSSSYRYSDSSLSAINGQVDISRAKLDALHSSIAQNAAAVEQITGRTVQSILGEVQAQEQVAQAQNTVQAEMHETSISLDNLIAKLQQYIALRERAYLEKYAFREDTPTGTRGAVYAESKKSAKSSMLQLLQEIDTKQDEINQADQQDILLIRQKNQELITLKSTLLGIYDSFSYSLGGSDKFLGSDLVSRIGAINQEINNLAQVKTGTGYPELFKEIKAITNIDPYVLATVFENAADNGLSAVQILREFDSLMKQQSSPAQSIQQTADQTAVAAANAEQLEQNLADATANAENLEKQMADAAAKTANATVTGTVDIGNKVAVTGANGEQLALEKTLRATYNIQQNMVKILSEINSKMISGAEAATASYEQLKAVMTETVEAAKALGAEEEKEEKKQGNVKTKDRYAIIKNAYKEMIRLKKQLPNAGEEETKQIEKQIKHYHNQIDYQKKKIAETKTSIALEEQKIDVLKRQADVQNAINADARKKAQEDARKTAASKLESSYNTVGKTLRSVGSGDLIDTAESKLVQELIVKFKEYDVLLATVNNDFERLSDNQQQEIQDSIDAFNKLTQAQKDAFKSGAYNTYNKSGRYQGSLTDLSQDSALSGLRKQVAEGTLSQKDALTQIATSIAKAKLETVDYNEETGKLTATFRDQQKNMQQITVGFQDVGNATRHTVKQTEQYKSMASKAFSSVVSKLKELLRYFSSFTIIMSAWNSVKKGVQVVKELDSALTELKVVTGNTTSEMARFQKQAQQVASAIASTTLEVTQSATEWARLGYSMSDALELAETSAIYSKVGSTDINVATENLTATLQAFYSDDIRNGIISAGDAAEIIIDKLVNVGDKFASSAAGMGQGISKAGAALIAANNTLDESLALITAGTTILQNEDETASALRTISLRLRGTKSSELEAAGEDIDGAIEDISKLYKVIKDMTSINGGKGVEIFNTDTGAYKSTYEILLEISKVWDKMTDLQQAGILETIAGKTRSNAAAAILSSSEILEEAYQASTESAGVASEKMEIYLNSIESHIAEFKQATSVLWENTLTSDFIKGFVDFGTVLVKITDKVGLLSVALAGASGFFGAKGQGKHVNQGVS